MNIFTDALNEIISPAATAKQLSTWVLSVVDRDVCCDICLAYANMLGVLFAGARQLSSQTNSSSQRTLQLDSQVYQTPTTIETNR
jgi:hypothetical protein